MKIGEFAKKYGITIDTIRHYMDIELLIPEKKGGHYFFSKSDEDDLNEILKLKELKFTLSEIQRVVSYARLSQLRSIEDKNYIRQIFLNKQNILHGEKLEIERAFDILKDMIKEIDDTLEIPQDIVRFGMPLSFINNIACPICSSDLELDAGKITRGMIDAGRFNCSCGYTAVVENGIYISLDQNDLSKVSDLNRLKTFKTASTLGQYIEGTDAALINIIYKSIDSMVGHMDIDRLENKVILEIGTGSGFFMRQFLSYGKVNNIYVITDHDIERIKLVKKYLEDNVKDCRVVFICTDFSKLPIKNNSVDYAINYLSSLNYLLNSKAVLDLVVLPKLKSGGKLVGCSYYGKSGSKFLKSMPREAAMFFEEKEYKKNLSRLPVANLQIRELEPICVDTEYEPLLGGSELYTIIYSGEK